TGVLVKGVDPKLSLGVEVEGGDEWKGRYDGLEPVLDLPSYVIAGALDGLRRPGAKPAKSKWDAPPDPFLDPPDAPRPADAPLPPGQPDGEPPGAPEVAPTPAPAPTASPPTVPTGATEPPAPSGDGFYGGGLAAPDEAPPGAA